MTVSIKDGLKLFGIVIVFGCAVFVCTFFLNFYLDALRIRDLVSAEATPLYEAQLLSAKLTCLISGLCLLLVSIVLILFYIKLYLDSHAKQIGILKALGMPNYKIALGFWVFGLSVLVGGLLGFGGGYAFAPIVYASMDQGGLPEIVLRFHAELLFFLVILPSVCFSFLAIGYAFLKLRLPMSALLRGKEQKSGKNRVPKGERKFFTELFFGTLKSSPGLAFFVAFACFCFAAMLQMGFSMRELAKSETMGVTVAIIGVVLAACSLLLSMTMLIRSNAATMALMRSCGYSLRDYWLAVLGGYHIPAFIGFAVGTAYQYGILKLMMELVFAAVESPDYSFDFVVFGVVLAVFIVLYELTTFLFTLSARKITVRELMTE